MNKETSNPFDEIDIDNFGVNQEETDAQKRIDYLVHRAFQQNDAGQELLGYWKDTLVMRPTVEPGMDAYTVGINEGMKTFIRNILLTIERIENE